MTQTNETCYGCGIALQSADASAPGYTPSHVLARGDQVHCRRCYRLEHYGHEQAVTDKTHRPVAHVMPDPEDVVRETMAAADAVVFITDLWDFESSFLPGLMQDASVPLYVVANKADLLPSRTPIQEAEQWLEQRCTEAGVAAAGVRLVSAVRGTGIKALRRLLEKELPARARVALVGATNVGKSSLLSRWLADGQKAPTVSPLPGTTQSAIVHTVGKSPLHIIDTPGMVATNRFTALLCPECMAQLVPQKRLRSKLVQMNNKRAIVMGGMAAFHMSDDNTGNVVTLGFSSERVPIHVAKAERATALIRTDGNPWLASYCVACRDRLLGSGWEEVRLTAEEGTDVVIPGLGWISPRKQALDITVTLPAMSHVIVRPRLVGSKKR